MGEMIRSAKLSNDITQLPEAQLRRAIRSDGRTPADVLKRLRYVLSLYWKPDDGPKAEAARLAEWDRALADLPGWALQRALDAWARDGKRRPYPAEIRELAQNQIAPVAAELSRRKNAERAREADMIEEPRRRHKSLECRADRLNNMQRELGRVGWGHLLDKDWFERELAEAAGNGRAG